MSTSAQLTPRLRTLRRRGPGRTQGTNRRLGTERRAVDPEAWPLVPAFLANRRADAGAIPDLVRAGLFLQILRLGHNMKGTAVSYGFPDLGEIGADLVRAAGKLDGSWVLQLNHKLLAFLEGHSWSER